MGADFLRGLNFVPNQLCVLRRVSNLSQPHFLHPRGRASRIQPLGSRRVRGPDSLQHFTVYQRHLEQQAVDADRRPRRWKATSGDSSGRRGEPDALAAVAAAKSHLSCLTLRPHRWQPIRLLRPWDFPGKSTGVGCHCLLLRHVG